MIKTTFFNPSLINLFLDHEISDNEITSHRHLYVGFHVPGKKKGHLAHGGHRKSSVINQSSRGHHGHVRNKHLKLPREDLRPGDPKKDMF